MDTTARHFCGRRPDLLGGEEGARGPLLLSFSIIRSFIYRKLVALASGMIASLFDFLE